MAERLTRIWQLVLISALLSTALVCTLAGLGFWWLRAHDFSLSIPLGEQHMQILLPPRIAVQADPSAPLHAGIDARVPIEVPLAQTFTIPLRENLRATVDFDHDVPLHLTVHYQGSVPVHQSIPVDTTVRASILGIAVDVPIRGNIPIDTEVPVDLTVPIERTVHLHFSAPITAHLDQRLRIPLDTTVHSVVPIHHRFAVDLSEPLRADVRLPPQPLSIIVKSWQLNLQPPASRQHKPGSGP